MASALDDAALEAVRLLRSVLNDPGQPGSVRVRAAAELLDRAGVTSPVAVEVRSSPAPVRVDLSGHTREHPDALAEGGWGSLDERALCFLLLGTLSPRELEAIKASRSTRHWFPTLTAPASSPLRARV